MQDEKFLTTTQLLQLTGQSISHVYRLIGKGSLPKSRIVAGVAIQDKEEIINSINILYKGKKQ